MSFVPTAKGNSRCSSIALRTGRKAQRDYTTFQHAVERGYAVVVEDVRGRYASDGEFLPYQNEGRDGYDTIEWAAEQPWSNGAVGTFGLSYPGAVQWLAAVESPPHLKAMVPAMTFSTPQNFFYAGGTWDMSWIEWIWDNIAPDIRAKKESPGSETSERQLPHGSRRPEDANASCRLTNCQELQRNRSVLLRLAAASGRKIPGGTGANCGTSTIARMRPC